MLEIVKLVVEVISLFAGALSAVFWLMASFVRAPVQLLPRTWVNVGSLDGLDKDGMPVNLLAALTLQSKLNAYGAMAAATAAAMLLGLRLPDIIK